MGWTPPKTEKEIEEQERKERESKTNRQELKKLLKKFQKNPDPKRLIQAYEKYNNIIDYGTFLDYTLSSLNAERGIPIRMFEGREYETKLNFDFVGECDEPIPYLKGLISKFSPLNNFLGDEEDIFRRSSTNYFYGRGPEEILTIMESRGKFAIKKKRALEKICFGIEGEEFVTARKETIKRDCSQNEVFQAIEEVTREGSNYMGSVERNRARIDLLSAETGKIYEIVLDLCKVKRPREEKSWLRRQIEAEYIGQLPGLPKQTE